MNLKPAYFINLRKELSTIYYSKTEAVGVLIGLEINPGSMDLDGTGEQIWDYILVKLENANKLKNLLDYVLIKHRENKVLKNTLAHIKTKAAQVKKISFKNCTKEPSEATTIYILHAFEDTHGMLELKDHLKLSTIGYNVSIIGVEYEASSQEEILQALFNADVILLFITIAFFANECLPLSLAAIGIKKRVVPVLIEFCWWNRIKVFDQLVPTPKNETFISKWPNRQEGLTTISQELSKVVEKVTLNKNK